jgi:hypothetical protein
LQAAQPGAVHVQAFGPDGRAHDSLHPETMRDAQQRGLVIAYDTGDVIDLQWHLDSNVVAIDKHDPITVRLLQPVWLYSGPGGIWLSTDGAQFRP